MIGKGNYKGLITDRSKTQEEIAAQIDVSAKEFQKIEGPGGKQEEGNQFDDGKEDVLPEEEKMDRPHSETLEEDDTERAERPKRCEGERQNP